jgi:hypothetical protein
MRKVEFLRRTNHLFKNTRLYWVLYPMAILAIPLGLYSFNLNQSTCHQIAMTAQPRQRVDENPSGTLATGKIAVFRRNPHYFQDPAGNPIFLVGPYTFWGPLSLLKGKANYYRLGVDGIDVPPHWKRHNPWPRMPASGPTTSGNEGKFDLTQFDEIFFADLRAFIADAQGHGIYVHVSFFNEIFVKYKPKCCGFGRHPFGNGNHVNEHLIGNVDRNHDLSGRGADEFYDAAALWGRTQDPQRLMVAALQRNYVEKVVLETRDFPNVFYEVGNEISASHDWFAYWVSFIRERANNPISVDDSHDKGFYPLTNERYPVDAVTYHTGDVVGDRIKRGIPYDAYQHDKILGNDTDGIGRDINRNADQNRQGAWLTFAAGGGVWGDYFDGWAIEAFMEEVTYFGHLLHFIEATQLKYWEMAPCDKITNKGKALAKPGLEYLVYSTTGGRFTIDLSEATQTLYYEWYNPRTGEFNSPVSIYGGGKRLFKTPDDEDWVLHVSSTVIQPRRSSTQVFRGETVYFSENFEDGKSNGWITNGEGWEICRPIRFTKIYCKASIQDSISLAGDIGWTDYAVQANILLANDSGGIAILGRVQNPSQYYQLALQKDAHTGEKKWWISKNDNGVWKHIASGHYNFLTNAFYHLRLEMHGSLLTASVAADGGTGHTFLPLGSGTDTSFTTGKIGIRAWGSTAKFDEIRVLSHPRKH